MSDDEHGASAAYGVIVGALYAIAVGVQVYAIVDELTDGDLSADLSAWWRTTTARWRHRRRLDAQVSEDLPWVLWQAHTILTDPEETTP